MASHLINSAVSGKNAPIAGLPVKSSIYRSRIITDTVLSQYRFAKLVGRSVGFEMHATSHSSLARSLACSQPSNIIAKTEWLIFTSPCFARGPQAGCSPAGAQRGYRGFCSKKGRPRSKIISAGSRLIAGSGREKGDAVNMGIEGACCARKMQELQQKAPSPKNEKIWRFDCEGAIVRRRRFLSL